MATRMLIIVSLVLVIAGLTVAYRRRNATDEALGARRAASPDWPQLPTEFLVAGAPCTWLIFTTPLCASCDLVESDLARAFPHHAVTKLDATARPEVASLYQVRRAPTTVLADHNGTILERLVGPEAVRAFVGAVEDPLGVDRD
ncbi:MAG: thioredoxin family protein [Acidimicrobiales bacterium]|nr:thioredoxin family protein [Acidimicrobiales bacterium]